MNDVLEFFTENPVVGIFLLIWLFNALFGKKKKIAGTQRQGKQAESSKKVTASTEKPKTLRDIIAEAERRMQQSIQESERKPSAPQTTADAGAATRQATPLEANAPRRVASPIQPNEDPYAFHSMSERPIPVREDYDLRNEPFGFHDPLAEPEEKEYHLGGFKAFQSAHGLSRDEKRSITESAPEESIDNSWVMKAFSDPNDLRRMIILKEILDKPKALR